MFSADRHVFTTGTDHHLKWKGPFCGMRGTIVDTKNAPDTWATTRG